MKLLKKEMKVVNKNLLKINGKAKQFKKGGNKDLAMEKGSKRKLAKLDRGESINKHQKELEELKDLDPELYEFLKLNDKKLQEFNLLDSDESSEENDVDEANSAQSITKSEDSADSNVDECEEFHKPSGKLEVASDESDFDQEDEEDNSAKGYGQKVSLNLLRQWELQLQRPNVSIEVIRQIIQGFNSALASISTENIDSNYTLPFKIVGAPSFNAMVQLCVLHLQPAIMRFLGIGPHSKIPLHKCRKWVKVRSCLRYYFTDLIRIVERVSSTNILSVLLKHLHQMADMVGSYSALGKTILKRLIVLWATGDETVRVLAFLCILKITNTQQVSMLHHVLKAMYLAYVRNSKFVSPNTLPGINFMRRSLVEIFALDLNVTYQHAFLYIRQLAIHLRNAIILKKKDSFQAVYNWQYVNSLRLWADLLAATATKQQLQPLIYPLVTIIIGVIRLIPTAQYFPLRFHCIQALITLGKATSTFVPLIALILEVLRSNTFNRKHSAVSMRPLSFTCILRLNKTQLSENGFRDEVVEQVFALTLEYLAHESASLGFSDLVVPLIVSLKVYLKECRIANHARKLKQLLDKIQENVRFIDQERKKISFGLNNAAQVLSWETQMCNKGTPLAVYYASWVKTHETKKRRQAAQVESVNNDYGLPEIKRKPNRLVKSQSNNGPVDLFPSDSDNEILTGGQLVENQKKLMTAKKNKKGKISKIKKLEVSAHDGENDDDDNNIDIVKDLDLDDW